MVITSLKNNLFQRLLLVYICPLNVNANHFTLLEINEQTKMIYHYDSKASHGVIHRKTKSNPVRRVVEVTSTVDFTWGHGMLRFGTEQSNFCGKFLRLWLPGLAFFLLHFISAWSIALLGVTDFSIVVLRKMKLSADTSTTAPTAQRSITSSASQLLVLTSSSVACLNSFLG